MKTITFLRHSKSSWDYILEDIDRPLNEVGIEKIKKVAESSKHQFINSDIIFSSTANRAIHTCLILTRQVKFFDFPILHHCSRAFTLKSVGVLIE